MTLAEHLRALVQRSGRSRADLADHLGVSPQCLGHWLTGYRTPSFEHVCAILRVVGATSDDIAALFDPTPAPSIPEGWVPRTMWHRVEHGEGRWVDLSLTTTNGQWSVVAVDSSTLDLDSVVVAVVAGPGPLAEVIEASRAWIGNWHTAPVPPACAGALEAA